ncbi:MAG: LLM class flavin-dependent oxidoreductase [Dehalococcoidia bacterium]
MRLTFRFDMRQPDLRASSAALYAAMLDMCAWGDGLGFEEAYLCEHHGAEDGYLPSPITLGAAVAARTQRIRIHITALVVTLHHPLRLAEDLAILDIVSNGRLTVTAGMGYRPHEFAMMGVDIRKRLRIYLDTLQVLKSAWTGEPFEYDGRTVRVTPKPVQPGGPPLLMGGSSEAAAQRAARLGFGFKPGFPPHYEMYRQELRRLGRPDVLPYPNQEPVFLYVTEDPDRDWPIVGPHALYTARSYAQWGAERGSGMTLFDQTIASLHEARRNPMFQIVTPEQCVAFARSLEPNGELVFTPLIGGLNPELAWRSLRLFEREVLPRLRAEGLR